MEETYDVGRRQEEPQPPRGLARGRGRQTSISETQTMTLRETEIILSVSGIALLHAGGSVNHQLCRHNAKMTPASGQLALQKTLFGSLRTVLQQLGFGKTAEPKL